ncbi:hypothetical protein K438DRAFT_1753249 [Mycena galopus ATCC 62051]|nr:hypothetical protein K438DRAFT_1753249 [Mycena galopus ATCC 62051]
MYHKVPFHYAWTSVEKETSHFHRCSPEFLGELQDITARRETSMSSLLSYSLWKDDLHLLLRSSINLVPTSQAYFPQFLDVPLTAHAPHLSLVLQDFLADDSLYKPEGGYMMTHTAALAEMILSPDHRHSQERLPAFVNILATPSRIARCKPNYVTGLSDLGIFHIISMREVIEDSDLPTLSQQFKQPLGALKKEPYILTLITPSGYLTPPHVNAMSFCQLHTHFHGQKLWMCWPPTPHNLEWLRTHYPKGADEGTLLLAIAHLENLEIFHLDETVCSFLVPPLTIHAVVSLTTCTHFGITLDKCVEDVSTVGSEHVSFMLDSAVEELRVWKGVLKDGPRKQVTSVMRQKFAEECMRLSKISVVED